MSAISGIGGYISFRTSSAGRAARGLTDLSALRQLSPSRSLNLSSIRQQHSALTRLRDALKQTRFAVGTSGGSTTTQTTATSLEASTALTLDPSTTAARMESTGEINDQFRTSYAPTDPVFSGSSTANPHISGTYTGSVDDVLTFTATDGGAVESYFGIVAFDVTDQYGNFLESVWFYRGSPKQLSSGLTVSFEGGGNVTVGDSFQVTVDSRC